MEMMNPTQFQKRKLIREVWGESCLECDFTKIPNLHLYSLKKEDVAVLSCPSCDFTIVVVEIETLYKSNLKKHINEDNNEIITTHSAI